MSASTSSKFQEYDPASESQYGQAAVREWAPLWNAHISSHKTLGTAHYEELTN